MVKYVLAIYEIDQAYGGPEEGGWWYGTGELRSIVRSFPTRESAGKAAYRCNSLLGMLQRGHRSVSSVAYVGGRLEARVYEGCPPEHYPQERPHYE